MKKKKLIEPETEEYRNFIDNEVEDDQGPFLFQCFRSDALPTN